MYRTHTNRRIPNPSVENANPIRDLGARQAAVQSSHSAPALTFNAARANRSAIIPPGSRQETGGGQCNHQPNQQPKGSIRMPCHQACTTSGLRSTQRTDKCHTVASTGGLRRTQQTCTQNCARGSNPIAVLFSYSSINPASADPISRARVHTHMSLES